jgi:hypothetical protein
MVNLERSALLYTAQQRVGFFVDDEAKHTLTLSLHGLSIDDARAARKAGLDGSDMHKVHAWRTGSTQPPTLASPTGDTVLNELRALRQRIGDIESGPRTSQRTPRDSSATRASTISGGLASTTLEKLDDGASAFDFHATLTGWRMHLGRIHPYVRDLAFEGSLVASTRYPIDDVSAVTIDDQLKGIVLLAIGRHLDDPATSKYATCRSTKELVDKLKLDRGTFRDWDYTAVEESLHTLDPTKFKGPTQLLRHAEELLGRLMTAARHLDRTILEPGHVLARRLAKSLQRRPLGWENSTSAYLQAGADKNDVTATVSWFRTFISQKLEASSELTALGPKELDFEWRRLSGQTQQVPPPAKRSKTGNPRREEPWRSDGLVRPGLRPSNRYPQPTPSPGPITSSGHAHACGAGPRGGCPGDPQGYR